jgi:hypothetical protein
LLIIFTAAKIHQVQKQKVYVDSLVLPQTPPPPPPKIVVPKVKILAPPQPEIVKLEPPKIIMPKPTPQPEIAKPVKLDTPDQPKLPPAPPKAVTPPPQPKTGMFESPKPTEVANNQVAPSVKAGGFGDPLGAKPNPPISPHQVPPRMARGKKHTAEQIVSLLRQIEAAVADSYRCCKTPSVGHRVDHVIHANAHSEIRKFQRIAGSVRPFPRITDIRI